MKIIDRYISLEIIRPFMMVVIGVIVIMLSVRLSTDMTKIIEYGAPWKVVFKSILYKIPEFIVLGLPVAYMIATLLGLARMSKDYEIIAIRSAGIGSRRIMLPILLISILVSFLNFYIDDTVVPWAQAKGEQANEIIQTEKAKNDKNAQNQNLFVFGNIHFKGFDSRFFSVRRVDKKLKQMEGILIYDSHPDSPKKMISARTGQWEGNIWKLRQGVVQEYSQDTLFVEKEYTFDNITVDTKINIENYLNKEIKPQELTRKELQEMIAAKKEGGQDTKDLEIEYLSKYAKPMGPFFTALIAAPIGLKFAKGGYIGFAISIILTFFFFVIQQIGTGLGTWGMVPIEIAAWLPNLVFGCIGLVFLVQVD